MAEKQKQKEKINKKDYIWPQVIDHQDKKAEYFDKIAELFFEGNFGTTTKSEIDLLMFNFFMESMIEMNMDNNGVLDYRICSDYQIGKELGITKERVRNLKIKKQARYPHEFDWRKSLESIESNIVFDEKDHRIIIPIQDPNLYLEIQNFIEENGGYIEIQRNRSVLQMRPEHFLLLLYEGIEDEKEKKKIQKKVILQLKKRNEEAGIDVNTPVEMKDIAYTKINHFFDFVEDVLQGVNNPFLLILKAMRTINKVINKEKK